VSGASRSWPPAGLEFDDWPKHCLAHDPFAGDFGDGERVLRDKIVEARKFYHKGCDYCGDGIVKYEEHRVLVEASDGTIKTFRFCQECCIAMAFAAWDDGEDLESRLGQFNG
jgi:hypothetical protein